MQRIEADGAPVEFEPCAEFARHGDFVGLLIGHGAAQVMPAGHGVGGEHMVAAGVPRLFAIKDDEFAGWRSAAHLGLKSAHGALDAEGVGFGAEPAEGGLAPQPRARQARRLRYGLRSA